MWGQWESSCLQAKENPQERPNLTTPPSSNLSLLYCDKICHCVLYHCLCYVTRDSLCAHYTWPHFSQTHHWKHLRVETAAHRGPLQCSSCPLANSDRLFIPMMPLALPAALFLSCGNLAPSTHPALCNTCHDVYCMVTCGSSRYKVKATWI